MALKDKHQKSVLVAVARYIERRKSMLFRQLEYPDEVKRQEKAIDLIAYNSQTHLFEHTRIESFPKQIASDNRLTDLLGPLEESLNETLPGPGQCVLYVDKDSILGKKNYSRTREILEEWVRIIAPRIEIGSKKEEYLSEIDIRVALRRSHGKDGKFGIGRYLPNDLERERQKRMRDVLEAKFPKLSQEKSKVGGISVIVLESNDIALANNALIAGALKTELDKKQVDIPDEIYLVETELQSTWYITILKEGRSLFPQIDNYGPHEVESNPVL